MSSRIQHISKASNIGKLPAIVLINPKYSDNLAACIRAAACFDIEQIWFTGSRLKIDERLRTRREFRHKSYEGVDVFNSDYPFDAFMSAKPVAVEFREGAQDISGFTHPEAAVYVFGPEDGSIPSYILRHCHSIIRIPSRHCLNLAAAVNVVLYDRVSKQRAEIRHALAEVLL